MVTRCRWLAFSTILLIGTAFLASLLPHSVAENANPADFSEGSNGDSGAGNADSDHLVVEVRGVADRPGNVIALIFDNSAAFRAYDVERAVGYEEVAAAPGTLLIEFPYLTGGPYAVVLFHDEDGDRDLNMDGYYPTEGYGTSGARDAMHEPDYREAAVAVGRASVQMHYWR